MSQVAHPISQPSIDVSPIWSPIIEEKDSKLQLRPFTFSWEYLIFFYVYFMHVL
jgi:hypothetical protein